MGRWVLLGLMVCGVVAGWMNTALAQNVPKKVGVLIWAEEVRYQRALAEFVEIMKGNGFSDIVIRRAGGNKVTAVQMADELAAQKFDLYYSMGTSGTGIMAKAIQEAPLVFSNVYDPVDAGLVQGWDSSRNNLTGVTYAVSMEQIVQWARQFVPIRIVAVLYTPNEKNSESQLKHMQQFQGALGISVIPVPILNEADMVRALPFLDGKAQAILVSGSIVIGKSLAVVIDFAARNKIMTMTHVADLIEKGIMVGVCADDKEQGVVAGQIALRVLNGVKPADVPIERPTVFRTMINKRSIQAAGIVIPPDVLTQAGRVIE